jgi:hypothetical protein
VKRIYHTWDEWECYPAGFYEEHPPKPMKAREATWRYAIFLRDIPAFEAALERVLSEWKNSCEHYLSNVNMNRIAWLGQASACIALGLPSCFRAGFNLLTVEEQNQANATALKFLNRWLVEHGESEVTIETAKARTAMDLY